MEETICIIKALSGHTSALPFGSGGGRLATGFLTRSADTDAKPAAFDMLARMPVASSPDLYVHTRLEAIVLHMLGCAFAGCISSSSVQNEEASQSQVNTRPVFMGSLTFVSSLVRAENQ